MQQQHKQQAFTLVEIMIVVAIIGILAVIAIPAYSDFTVRSKVSEGLSLASGAKTSVMEYYMTQGKWPVNNTVAGLPKADSIKGDFVRSVYIHDNQVVVTFGDDAGVDLTGRDLIMAANDNGGSISWTCKGSDIENKYLPPNCRDTKQQRTDGEMATVF
jgi:type IV pilus assembly protein PilA